MDAPRSCGWGSARSPVGRRQSGCPCADGTWRITGGPLLTRGSSSCPPVALRSADEGREHRGARAHLDPVDNGFYPQPPDGRPRASADLATLDSWRWTPHPEHGETPEPVTGPPGPPARCRVIEARNPVGAPSTSPRRDHWGIRGRRPGSWPVSSPRHAVGGDSVATGDGVAPASFQQHLVVRQTCEPGIDRSRRQPKVCGLTRTGLFLLP